MDTELMNFGEEHFNTFNDFDEYVGLEDPACLEGTSQYYSEWEDERELNGDIGLIPVSGTVAESMDLSGSPPSDIFQKMVDWSTFINIDIIGVGQDMEEDSMDQMASPVHSPPMKHNVEWQQDPSVYPAAKTIKAPVKKIDMDAQKYIVDENEDLIDVETVYEPSNLPILEAADALSLLEQFETSEQPNTTASKTMMDIELGKVPSSPNEIFDTPVQAEEEKQDKKEILKALPQELITRINESGKRKPITVIPPIPQKRPDKPKKVVKRVQEVKIDHDYCTKSTAYPKEPRKDSGFSSEEDDRSVIGNQPTVKNADGKLMVSLLKANTIHPNNQKKKLNLAEYKKRRPINSGTMSHNISPMDSACSSPLPEDEHTKRVKHQEKLMKMAAELLNTPPKSGEMKQIPSFPTPQIKEEPAPVIKVEKTIPPDMEMVTCVSIGVNTEVSTVKNRALLDTVQQLADIKPLLQKASNKINSNSFITSVIENIPKVKNIQPEKIIEPQQEVREDLVIVYRPKDREQVKVKHKACQTHFDVDGEEELSRYRRRITHSPSVSPCRSTSSSYTRRSHRRYDSPHSSRASSRSRSRSRSSSPKRQPYHLDKERSDEVNERRVIYVGRISRGTTKDDLQRRFQQFGRITRIGLHFRKYGDNFGFVTFAHRESAYDALEHGNDEAFPKYDLCFGGRRIFCENDYSDLDAMREEELGRYYTAQTEAVPFDVLLKEAQEKLRNRKP